MRKPAKLEAEIAALAAEVEEVARKRGRALPTTQDWVDLFMALGVTYEEMADAPQDGEGDVAVFARLTRREITPAAAPLLESLLAAEAAALARDRPACYQTLRELRAPLTDLLARRAQTWCQRWLRAPEFEELYYGPRQMPAGSVSRRLSGRARSGLRRADRDQARAHERLASRPVGREGLGLRGHRTEGVAGVGYGRSRPRPPATTPHGRISSGRPAVDGVARGGRRRTRTARCRERGRPGRGQSAPPGARESTPDLRYSRRRDPEITPD